MIAISGPDLAVIEAIAGALGAERLALDELELGALVRRARGGRLDLVLVDQLSRLGEPAAPDTDALLEKVIRAAGAASAGKLVLVTSRGAGDPVLASLRRSGVAYELVRVARLLELDPDLRAARRVIVGAELIATSREAVPAADVAEVVARMLARQSAGATVEVEPSSDSGLLEALARLEIEAAVGGWRAAWWKLLKRPALRVATSGMIELDAGLPPARVEDPAPVLASSLGTGGWQ